jgi:hypothetical protein
MMVDDGGGWGIGLLGMSCYSNDKKPVAFRVKKPSYQMLRIIRIGRN